MKKSPEAFRTISEVADWLDVPTHVLRFWESRFSQVKPVKRAGGRRYYRPNDMLLIGGIKALLHDEGMTIRGVQKLLREEGVKHVAGFSKPLDTEEEPLEAEAEAASPPDDRPPAEAETPAETVLTEPRTAGPEEEEEAAALDASAEAEVLSLVRALTGGADERAGDEGDADERDADETQAEPDAEGEPRREQQPDGPAVPLFGSRRAAEPELPFAAEGGEEDETEESAAPADVSAGSDSAQEAPAEAAAAGPRAFVAEGVPESDPDDNDPRYARGAGISARLIARSRQQIAPPPGTSIEDVVARLREIRARLDNEGA